MPRQSGRWRVAFVRPPLVALRFLFNVMFSVPSDWLDKRLYRRNRERFEQEVRDALPFLFSEFQAQVVPDGAELDTPPFDYTSVTVALDDLIFRFWRGRGELSVLVAPVFAPSDQHDLSLVLSWITGDGEIAREHYLDLWHVRRVLEPNLSAIKGLFSLSRFQDLKRRLDSEIYSADRVAIKAWEAEINRRLYGR